VLDKKDLMLGQLLINGVVSGCLIGVLAMGFALVYQTTRIFHVAFGATHVAAAYAFYWAYSQLTIHPVAALILAISAASLLAVAVDRGVYAPLLERGGSTLGALLGSLGVYIVVISLISLFFGSDTKVLRAGEAKTFAIGSVIIAHGQALQIGICLALFLGALVILRLSPLGTSIRALRDDPELLRGLGHRPQSIRLAALLLGTGFGAVVACLNAADGAINPYIGLPVLLAATVAMVIGGRENFFGPVVGGLFLGIISSFVTWLSSSRWVDAITFLLLLTFLLVRPQGLLGTARRVEEATK
jgi:branched-chain amino acid transport system permease protein